MSSSKVQSLYVHVPFCESKCDYCDFYSIAPIDLELISRYLQALRIELQLRGGVLDTPLKTVFIGGGTPTFLSAEKLSEFFSIFNSLVDDDTEFSIESNPGTLDERKVDVLLAGGVNRVSLGVQSFCDDDLKKLGRIHNSQAVTAAVDLLRCCGITNLNMDLIYALPGQTLERWLDNLRQAVELCPEHISCYALSYEHGTAFYDSLLAGEFFEHTDEAQEEMYYATIDYLKEAGYEHYETSNFALPGKRCQHNLVYWRNEEYLGLGPAAASYIDRSRLTSEAYLDIWAESLIEQGSPGPMEIEQPDLRGEMAETLMLGLRLTEGISQASFENRFGKTVEKAFPQTVKKHILTGGLSMDSGRIFISSDKLFVSNEVLADFIAESSQNP